MSYTIADTGLPRQYTVRTPEGGYLFMVRCIGGTDGPTMVKGFVHRLGHEHLSDWVLMATVTGATNDTQAILTAIAASGDPNDWPWDCTVPNPLPGFPRVG